MAPPRSFSATARLGGDHWHITLRHGVPGRRALLGTLVLDKGDVYNLTYELGWLINHTVTRAISGALQQLDERNLLQPGATLPEVRGTIVEMLQQDLREFALTYLKQQLNLEVTGG